MDFDIKKVPESRFFKLRDKYFTQKEFTKDNILKQSEAAGSIYQWIIAIDQYQKVKKNVDPKEKKLVEAQLYLEKVDKILADKNQMLKDIQNQVKMLNDELLSSQNKSANLKLELDTAAKQLYRAEKLVTGLGSERKRWEQNFNSI